MAPCRLEDMHQRFGKIFCFHPHGLSEKLVHLRHITRRPFPDDGHSHFHCSGTRKYRYDDPVCAVRTNSISDLNKIGSSTCLLRFLLFISHVLSHYCATRTFAVPRWSDSSDDLIWTKMSIASDRVQPTDITGCSLLQFGRTGEVGTAYLALRLFLKMADPYKRKRKMICVPY